ncbi:MAG: ABC transporter permease [Planctomycetota bacterium]|jgi:ribose transport system permease protein
MSSIASVGSLRSMGPVAGLLAAILVLVGFFWLFAKNFLSITTLLTIANSIPDTTVVAVGMTLVLIAGGIDLSVGSVMALSASMLGLLLVDCKSPLWLAALGAILLGAFCGGLNGWISAFFRIPAFIVTLGMLEIARGAAYLLTNSTTKYVGSSLGWFSDPVAGLGVSVSFLIAIGVVVLGQWILHQTVLGRSAVAIGTNAESVRMAGVRTTPPLVYLYAICGGLCGLAAMMQSARLSTVDPNSGIGMELSAIAACVIGGTSLRGGQGSVFRTFIGVLIISILQTGLAQMGATDPIKRVVTGSVIILAVLLDSLRKRSADR